MEFKSTISSGQFRLKRWVLGFCADDVSTFSTYIPSEAVVEVIADGMTDARMVRVEWNGEPFAVFTHELEECAECIGNLSQAAG